MSDGDVCDYCVIVDYLIVEVDYLIADCLFDCLIA